MVYPKFKGKEFEESLVHPHLYIKYAKKRYPKVRKAPKKYIITYQKYAREYFKKKYNPKEIKLHGHLKMFVYKDIGLIKMDGIGAPNVVNVFEGLIAHGGKTFLNIGTAGGLYNEGIFLCNKALRDEGTSYHYLPHGQFTYPDAKLTKKLGKFIEKQGIEFFEGTTWTIDAPYRETKAEVERYARRGIVTVEMEASALFAVAKYRKVKIASAFVVSDILGKKWEPKSRALNVKKTHYKLIDAAVECLKGK